jgi:glycosyltransferase involved in cell wall biosynthesis
MFVLILAYTPLFWYCFKAMNLLISLPAFNEACSISGVLERIPRVIDNVDDVDILVVDDGSEDATDSIAEARGAVVVRHGRNRGVGRAFQTMIAYAIEHSYDALVTIDADGQFNPEDIPQLVAPIVGGADFVTCSRFLDESLIPSDMSYMKRWGNHWMAKTVSRLTHQKVTDAACGFRAYSREALLRLNLFGAFTYTQETLLDLAYKGLTIHEVPLRVRGKREHGVSHISSNLFLYGLRTLKIILKTVRDYKPLKFFGVLGISIMLAGMAVEAVPFWNFFETGSFTPYKFLAFLGGGLVLLGIIIVVVGFVADMLKRVRLTQEQTLYYLKKTHGHGDFSRIPRGLTSVSSQTTHYAKERVAKN